MSNPNVGSVYQQVIKDVIETSRVDFEEGGVDESVLEELAKGWQKKLSSLGVAQFPWDPKQEPAQTPIINNPPSVASNYHPMDSSSIPQPQSTFTQSSLPPMQSMNDPNGPRIKAEPGSENGQNALTLPSYNGGTGMTAQQRAAQNLQATYGSRAAASINAIQSNLPQGGQQVHQQNVQQVQNQQQQQQRPANGQMQRPPMGTVQYQQAMAEATARQRSAALQNAGNSQTDGADESEIDAFEVMKRFDAQGNEVEMGRVEIDHMIRRKIEAMGRTMEGGGLMLPLKERAPAKGRKRKISILQNTNSDANSHAAPVLTTSREVIPQFDGGDEFDEDDKSNVLKEEEQDEDAINSDLDDPDEGLNDDDDDDDAMGHIMLCMYDKVQRVKNKWKCVMKDGVLTVNGKEYVFHKASGEYEW